MVKIPAKHTSLIARYVMKVLDIPASKFDDVHRAVKSFDYDPKKVVKDKKFKRPSGFRRGNKRKDIPGVKQQTWDAASKEQNGLVKDPLTKKIIHELDKWVMGHRPGQEFRKQKQFMKHLDDTLSQPGKPPFISRKDVIEMYQQYTDFRPELGPSNSSHLAEGADSLLFPVWVEMARKWGFK